jgi:hypothetical protein
MEFDYKTHCSEKEIKLARNYMNAKIDIFQDIDSYVFRNKEITQEFKNSYEHELIQNDSAKILSNSSNMLIYCLGNGVDDITKAKHLLKKNFTLDISQPIDQIEDEYTAFKKKMMIKKLETDPDYTHLCTIISHPSFHQLMMSRNDVLRYVISHRYLQYHPQHEEIIKKYKFFHLIQQHRAESSDNMEEDEESNNS